MATLISVGQVVDQSVHHYRQNFKKLMNISLYLFAGAPFFIAATILYSNTSLSRLFLSAICTLIGMIISAGASIWTFNALILTVNSQTQNKKAKTDNLNRLAWKKFLPSLGVSIIIALILIGLAILCLLPGTIIFLVSTALHSNSMIIFLAGILFVLFGGLVATCLVAWLGITTIFAPYALILENLGVIKSLKRAHQLVLHRWWLVLIRIIIPNLVIGIILFLAPKITHFILSLLVVGSPSLLMPLFIVNDLINIGLTTLTIPFLVIADYYVFQSLVDTCQASTT